MTTTLTTRPPSRTFNVNASRRSGRQEHRDLDTRVGTIDVAVPKLREGSFFPDWLLQRRRRAEAALTTMVATCYLLGVSTRRMDKLVQPLGISGLSKSQVSEMANDLDELATGVNADGYREILGIHVATTGAGGRRSSATWSPAG